MQCNAEKIIQILRLWLHVVLSAFTKKSSKKKFFFFADSEFVLLSYIKILQRNFLNANWFYAKEKLYEHYQLHQYRYTVR